MVDFVVCKSPVLWLVVVSVEPAGSSEWPWVSGVLGGSVVSVCESALVIGHDCYAW